MGCRHLTTYEGMLEHRLVLHGKLLPIKKKKKKLKLLPLTFSDSKLSVRFLQIQQGYMEDDNQNHTMQRVNKGYEIKEGKDLNSPLQAALQPLPSVPYAQGTYILMEQAGEGLEIYFFMHQ